VAGVGGDAVDRAPALRGANLADIGGVDKQLHLLSPNLVEICVGNPPQGKAKPKKFTVFPKFQREINHLPTTTVKLYVFAISFGLPDNRETSTLHQKSCTLRSESATPCG
jgi:hypothetical protein